VYSEDEEANEGLNVKNVEQNRQVVMVGESVVVVVVADTKGEKRERVMKCHARLRIWRLLRKHAFVCRDSVEPPSFLLRDSFILSCRRGE